MNLKQIKIITIINIFILSFISHFIYDLFPNILFSFFFPVNESIAEHMKILFTSTLLSGILEFILLKINNINFNNYKLKLLTSSLISIPIFLIIFLPLYYLIGENLILNIILMLITYIISQSISYKILILKPLPYLNALSIPIIILIYIIFIILTYNPPQTPIFYDTLNNHYGIKRTYYTE